MISSILTFLGSVLPFVLSLFTGKKEDVARSLGAADQKLADAQAQAQAETKANAVPYPERAAANDQLRDHKF